MRPEFINYYHLCSLSSIRSLKGEAPESKHLIYNGVKVKVEKGLASGIRAEFDKTPDTLIRDRCSNNLPRSYLEAMEDYTASEKELIERGKKEVDEKYSNPICCVFYKAVLKDLGRGLNGEPLTMLGTAFFKGRPEDVKTLLFMSSGVHGAESRLTIAALSDLLRKVADNNDSVPVCDNVAYVILPNVNPFGASFGIRENQNNVDINRNFGPYEGLYPAGELEPLWHKVDPILNPQEKQSAMTFFLLLAWLYIQYCLICLLYRESSPLPTVCAGGQNRDKTKIFYAGREAESNVEAIQVIVSDVAYMFPNAEYVIHEDDHTGLGKDGRLNVLLAATNKMLEVMVFEKMKAIGLPGLNVECLSNAKKPRVFTYCTTGSFNEAMLMMVKAAIEGRKVPLKQAVVFTVERGVFSKWRPPLLVPEEAKALQVISHANQVKHSQGIASDPFKFYGTDAAKRCRDGFCPQNKRCEVDGLSDFTRFHSMIFKMVDEYFGESIRSSLVGHDFLSELSDYKNKHTGLTLSFAPIIKKVVQQETAEAAPSLLSSTVGRI